MRESGRKKYFTDHQTATTIQLFFAMEGTSPSLFFF